MSGDASLVVFPPNNQQTDIQQIGFQWVDGKTVISRRMMSIKNQFIRPMPPRDIHEGHRPATPLELLFDLVSVIAIAAAAAGLHHAISENHIVEGVFKFCLAFFGIWWAWMNYTWFASAYDNGDTFFKLLTMVIMVGALTMAAGISSFFATHDLALIVIGYVIM